MTRWTKQRKAVLVLTALAAAIVACSVALTASAASRTHHATAVLTMESSPQNSITDNFNPFVPSSAASLLAATSLIYEPLIQFDVAKPSVQYPWLATGYKWSNGGKTITFTIRSGVKWSDGTDLTPADVAFTYNLLKKYPDINEYGVPVTSATSTGSTVTVNFSSSQYTNLQNDAGQVYIVPQAIWSTVGDPAKYLDTTPVGSGPFTLDTFTSQGVTLKANPSYWGGQPKVDEVDFPVYASNSTVLSALQTNQLDWAGNFISGLQKTFVNPDPAHHKVWFAPVNTNSLFPNLNTWPTNQLAVRQAISLAIDRTAMSQQGESGLEPVAKNASGLVLPNFQNLLASSVAKLTLGARGNPAAAKAVLRKAGFVMGSNGFFKDSTGRELKVTLTDPASYTDYAEDDSLAAAAMRKAGIDAVFNGQSVSAWSSGIATGKFQLSMHWSQTSISAYQLYNNWLNSALATDNANGNFERLNEPSIDALLGKLAGAVSVADQLKYLAPIEKYVATNVPIIPTVYGAAFDEYNTLHFTGWPSAADPYESGSPNAPTNEVVVLRLTPTGS
jgi:peptide/nickel transport system substrate-binding protein